MHCVRHADQVLATTIGTLRCAVCGETSSIPLPPGAEFSDSTTFLCRKCTGYSQPEPRKRRQRIPPPTREGREVPWDDRSFRTPSGALLSGEEAAYAADYYFDQPHVTSPRIRAYSLAERDLGILHQEALALVSEDDLPKLDAALEGLLDDDERWVMKIRAMGESRDSYLGQLSETERRRFQAAWRRLSRRMPEVRQALRKRAAEKRVMAEFERVDDY